MARSSPARRAFVAYLFGVLTGLLSCASRGKVENQTPKAPPVDARSLIIPAVLPGFPPNTTLRLLTNTGLPMIGMAVILGSPVNSMLVSDYYGVAWYTAEEATPVTFVVKGWAARPMAKFYTKGDHIVTFHPTRSA